MIIYDHVIERNHRIIRSSVGYTIPDQFTKVIQMVSGLTELPYVKEPHSRRVGETNDGEVDPGIVIPQTIQNVYGIPSPFASSNNKSSIALIEFYHGSGDMSYSNKDLLVPLYDIQYGGALAQGSEIWYWTSNHWLYEFSNDLFNMDPAPLVVSLPWGFPEIDQCDIEMCNGSTPMQYVQRVNTEFMKIGLRGISLIAASGDNGAPGEYNDNCLNDASPMSSYYPGSSPYITTVGSTMLVQSGTDNIINSQQGNDQPPICSKHQCATSTLEYVQSYPNASTTSGGGFSDYSPMPSYQKTAVEGYLTWGIPLPPSWSFNSSNRGYPDVSAVGHSYVTFVGGEMYLVDGSMCAAPSFAGMVALLNSHRLNNNQSPLGFLNPILYAAPSNCFNDITIGNNMCTEVCCTKYGYTATSGWDPASGLGTPNFKNLLAYISSLP
ncbi:hypothetical protein SAMD00019534_036780 [Acytostelium subglobosum LB1]|uniref:hypothetical protein n=1 Tax=Acytostelium subglobosum LB1 TaxID=1410327 RepID=UPI000644CB51|nr:hypothetical protein SAMD00019534_036780 [Acytostelium subglobosum LB1]GAM20503.1 hypothetical protein SAMD00019534_036780 [Acytostelium subglobosum LB1]|eukprot:XP_012760024.1 hypothetical protein SAMD00019534_036780 [Acytostelium subglobosum LB1]